MASTFRYSTIYGSDNSQALPRRQNYALGSIGAVAIDLVPLLSAHSEHTLVTATVTGVPTLSYSTTAGYYVGDRLTVLATGAHIIHFGLGFVDSSTSPEIPSGSPSIQSVYEFIFDGSKWQLSSYMIF
jgi:hypothetical protein